MNISVKRLQIISVIFLHFFNVYVETEELKIKNEGKRFEENIKNSANVKTMYFERIKDSPASFGNNDSSGVIRFTSKNPYDSFVFYKYRFFPLELKSTKGTSMSIQREKSQKGKMIKLHQIEGLKRAATYEGIIAGFLLDFRTSENTFFININDVVRFMNENSKGSINEKDVINYNGVLIEKVKKKVNYRYDLEKLFDGLIENS